MASIDKNDLMYRVRYKDPSLGALSSDDLASMMYERHSEAVKRVGKPPLPYEDFKRSIGYYADSYRREGSSAGDYGREMMAGGASLVGGVSNLVGRAFGVRPEDNALVGAADSAQEYWSEGLTPGYRYAQSQDGINIEKVGGALAGSLLPMAAGAGLGRALLMPVTNSRLGASFMGRVAAGDAAAASTLTRASLAAGAASEGTVAGSIGANEAYKRVMSMPLDTLVEAPEFLEAFDNTDPSLPEAERINLARMDLADSISARTGLQVGGATAALGPIGGGAALSRFIRGEGAGLRGTLAGTAREFGEEAAQSGTESYLTDRQMQRADQSINPMENVGESALLGGITGGVFGAFGSQMGRLNRQRYQAGAIPGLSSQDDLLKAGPQDQYVGGALDLSGELNFNPNAFGLALFEGQGRPLAPQVDLLTGQEQTIPVIPYRQPDIGRPEMGPGADYLLEQQAIEQATIENRRQELQQILASTTDPTQRRAIRVALASLPRPDLAYEPVPIQPVQQQPAALQMPEVRLPAAQRTIFGNNEYLDQEGPVPLQDDFQLETQPPVDNSQRVLPLEQAEDTQPAVVAEGQGALDLRTPEERVSQAEAKLREPIPTVANALETPPEGVAPGRISMIADVRRLLDKPITEALPALEEAMANPRLAPGTRGKLADFVKAVRKQAKSITAERAALQEEVATYKAAPVQKAAPTTQEEAPAPLADVLPATDGTKEGTGEGRKTRDFFAGITEGKSGAPTSSAAETKVLNTPPDGKFRKLYMKFTGNFDRHIEASIPGFREVQVKIAKAIADTYSDADVLDIGASEGALAKAISATGDNVRTVSLDPNPGMLRTFETKEQVEGAEYALAALGSKEQEGETAWEDEGQDIPYYKPDRQFDVVHEAMVFQFISKDRAEQVARVKELMKPDGVALFEEKYTAGKGLTAEQYAAGEAQKDAYKKQFFTEEAMKEKADTVLVGMTKNMPSPGEFEEVLGANFKYAVQFWDSGNFRGYAASDDKAKLDALIKSIGDTSSEFSTVETPRAVKDEPQVTDDKPLSFREERAKALKEKGDGGQGALFSLNKQSPLAQVFSKLGSQDDAYRTGTSTSMDLDEVISEVMKDGQNWRVTVTPGIASISIGNIAVATVEFDAEAEKIYKMPENSAVVQILPAFPMESDGNMFGQGKGLGGIYQAIFNWALNTGRVVRPDINLSGINSLRRSEHMIASMLKFGTSQHVRPHWTQTRPLVDAAKIEGTAKEKNDVNRFWGDENEASNEQERAAIFQANLHNLALASSLLAHKNFDRLNNWMVGPDGKLYEAPSRTGPIRFNEIADPKAAIPQAVQRGNGVGEATARRAVISRQAILGITPAQTGEFTAAAGDSIYIYKKGETVPTPPSRTSSTYPGLDGMKPAEGFFLRMFYSMAAGTQPAAGVKAIRAAVEKVTSSWGDHVKVQGVESFEDLPEDVKAQFSKTDGVPESALEGVYLPSSGEIYIVADSVRTTERTLEVLAHEAVGHFGMEQIVNMDNLIPQIQALEKAKAPAVVSAAAWVDANQKDLTPENRAKEIVAVLAERGEHKRIGLLKRMVAGIRNWLRSHGFARTWVDSLSENDVMYLLHHSEAYLKDKSGYTHPLLANVPSWRDRVKLSPTEGTDGKGKGTSTSALASIGLKQRIRGQKATASVAEIKAQAFGYTLDQLANSFSKYIPALPEYYDLHGRRDASMTESLKPAEDLFSDWSAWAATNTAQQEKLSSFAIESTRRNIHADRVYKNEAELFADQPWLKKDKNAFSDYLVLHQTWGAMAPEAKKWYSTIRDHYSKQWGEVKKEFRRFIERQTEPNSPERASMLADLDNEFGRVQGPYFPLMRLGDYLVVAEGPGLERVVSAVETPTQQAALKAELESRGYQASAKVVSEYNRVTDGVPSRFVESLDKMINARMDSKVIDQNVGKEIKSFINQLYLHSLPDVTGRKMLINRTGVAGAEQDLLRVFAKSSYQTAFLKSRLQWQSQIREALDSITEEVREVTSPSSPKFDPKADGNALSILANELNARYELASMPDPTPWLSKVQSFMYMWYLGLAPGYYITNLLQVPMITVPELSKKYAPGKVLAALTRAYAKALPIITSTWWTDTKMFSRSGVVKGAYDFSKATNLTPEEKALLNRGILDGRLDVTLAYDLGNVAMGNSPTWHKISKGVSYMGHTTEVLNRMATALAAYELSKDQEYTWRTVDNSQFNYSAYNKPRFMSPKYGKGLGIVFQFQQYRQRTLYNVAKSFRDAVTKDTSLSPQEKREARRYLAGVVGTHFLFAGLIGVPMAMTFVQAINMLLNLARDDEEPELDVLLEGRRALADMAENFMSKDAAKATAEVVMRGAPRMANIDLSGRVGAGEIFPLAREVGRGKEGKELFFEQLATSISGPFGGFLANAYEAKKKMDQGQVGAAIATTSPRAMRDMLNGYLMATSGVRTGSGYDTGFEPTQTEVFLKTIGLQPARLAEFQEARGSIIKQQKEQRSQRTLLKKLWVMAREDGDREEAKDIEERIQVYNKSHPKARLSKADLYKDLRRVQRLQDDPNFFMGIKVTEGERAMAEDTEELFNDE